MNLAKPLSGIAAVTMVAFAGLVPSADALVPRTSFSDEFGYIT